MTKPAIYLIGDIGATFSRLALFNLDTKNISEVKFFENQKFSHLEEIIEKFLLEELKNFKSHPEGIVLGVAGPVLKNKVKITNLGWDIEANYLKKKFKFKRVILKNDLYLLAGAFEFLKKDNLRILKKGAGGRKYPKAFISIGTGLGISFLISKNPLKIAPSEGGHSPLSFCEEKSFLNFLKERKADLVWEAVLSGRGLENLYEYYFGERKKAEEISEGAKKGLEKEVFIIKKFFQLLGKKCYEVAVTIEPFGGIYLAGGVIKALIEFLDNEEISQIMLNNFYFSERLRNLLEQIPIYAIYHPFPALLGAMTILRSLLK
ncbi:MAG: glucokinase [Caldimicrobium sp.]